MANNRRQVNININVAKADDASVMAGLSAKAAEWGTSPSETGKRLIAIALGMSEQQPVAQIVAAPQDNSALIKAMLDMTQELIALRKEVSRMKQVQAAYAVAPSPTTGAIPLRETERALTEADVELNPIFVSALKKAARPGMRIEQ